MFELLSIKKKKKKNATIERLPLESSTHELVQS